MKFNNLFFVLLFFVTNIFSDPLLVVVIMIKNEASVIVPTLQPFLDGGITNFVVFDTGSTDGTQDIVQAFFKKHNLVNSYIIEEPFVDFSTSRNRALDLTEQFFPQATFMLMPDAEWYIHNVERLRTFCEEQKDAAQKLYLVNMIGKYSDFGQPRLIRCRSNVRFVGRRHEVPNVVTYDKIPQEVFCEWRPSQKGQEKSQQRWQNDLVDFLQDFEKNPFDPRTLFYLAQTYECLGDWENAYLFYKKRSEIHGWDEENFITALRLGGVAEKIARQRNENSALFAKNLCPLAVQHYLEAFAMRPHRAEPLVKLAQYYAQRGEMNLSFVFAQRAAQIPYPEKDILFIEKYLYDFVRYDILGISAAYAGEYEIGEWAVQKALEVNPDAPNLHRNLKFYTDRL